MSLKYSVKANHPWRAAVVVSKKVSKSAVKRNRIRRRIFEWLRTHEDRIPQGQQMIISVFDSRVGTDDYSEIDKTLSLLLDQTK